MTSTTLRTIRSPESLPEAPETSLALAVATTRLEAIQTSALPALREHRAFLERTWYSEEADAFLVHVRPGLAIPCHPAGADRLASAVADEEAMIREEAALHELKQALEDYAAGGRLTREELDGEAPAPAVDFAAPLTTRPPEIGEPWCVAEREHTRRLHAYARLLKHEILDAVNAGDHGRMESLKAERDAVLGQLELRLVQEKMLRGRTISASSDRCRTMPLRRKIA